MSPDKLFDYLDGSVSDQERAKIERQLATDSHLQRELAMAREIHARMRHSREVLLQDDATINRGAVLGRRVAIAFAVLVFFNVVFGLYAIGFMEKKRHAPRGQEQNRQDLAQALEKAAASALPTPSLDVGEITISAPPKQRDAMANKVMVAAKQSGGSAVKNLNNENGVLLFAEIPAARLNQFQDALRKLGATLPASTNGPAPSEKAILQIRIVDAAK
jgi:anti-sigma factor RsiW